MSQDRWTEQDTTPERIESALREMLHDRHAQNDAFIPARVLNLVVVCDRDWKGEVANRLERVGRYHASRTILCAVQDGRTTLDAVAVISGDDPEVGGLGVLLEQVEIDLGPDQVTRLDTIIDPILVSDLPTLLWSPHGHREVFDAMLGRVDVVLLDTDDLDDVEGPADGLAQAADLLERAYVVDLAWLRTTPWRERLAASFDRPARRELLGCLDEVEVRHHASSIGSALLLAGWLSSCLDWSPEPLEGTSGRLQGMARHDGDLEVSFELEPVGQDVPGIAGVTVGCEDRGFWLSLERGRGGLVARQRLSADDPEREWQILGASRGEYGILGEGVRQALLRDPTYTSALGAARRFCP